MRKRPVENKKQNKIKSQLTLGFLLQTTHSSQTGDWEKSFQTEYY